MTDTINIIRVLLIRELEAFVREVEHVPDDEVLWQVMPGVTNSVGALARHVAGNLQHYVGHRLGGTSYVRDRAREFTNGPGTRAEVVEELRAAIAVIDRIMRELPSAELDKQFPEPVGGVQLRTGVFLAHLVSHTGYHLGQAGYLRRTLTGDPTTTGAIPAKDLKLV